VLEDQPALDQPLLDAVLVAALDQPLLDSAHAVEVADGVVVVVEDQPFSVQPGGMLVKEW
jgi:hypothetical protein